MKKICLFAAFCILISSASYGSVNQRYAWWKHRLNDLNTEKEKLIKNKHINESVVNILNNNIERVKMLLSTLEISGSDYPSNNYDKKKYSSAEIQEKTQKMFFPVFSLKYLEWIVNYTGNKDNHDFIKKIIGKDAYLKSDSKYLNLEIFLNTIIANSEQLYAQSLSSIQENTVRKVSKNNFYISPLDLKNIINAAISEYYSNFDLIEQLRNSAAVTQDLRYWIIKNNLTGRNKDIVSNEEILEILKARFIKYRNYINNLKTAAENCSSLSILDSPSLQKKFYSTMVKVSNLFNIIGFSLSPENNITKLLQQQDVNEITLLKNDFTESIKKARSDINKVQAFLLKEQEENNNKFNDPQNDLNGKLADLEIKLFSDSISSYFKEYESFTYNQRALSGYSEKYDQLEKEIKTGSASNSFEYAVKMHSIFPLLKDFNVSKIEREYENKQYLINLILRDIARLQTLMNVYKREGLKTRTISPDINSIKEKLRYKKEVAVGTWMMNETNFEKVNRKAVQKLEMSMKRIIWKSKNSAKNNSKTQDNIVKLDNYNIKSVMPNGWLEQNLQSDIKYYSTSV
ncbi:MAG: hypothetical protein V1874_13520 [Spirochaetota bacterium]